LCWTACAAKTASPSCVAELCRREGIAQGLYYKWSKDFMEAAVSSGLRQVNIHEFAYLGGEVMRRRIHLKVLPAVTALVLFWYAGGSSAQPLLATGPDTETSEDGLLRVDRSLMEAAWVQRFPLDLARYKKILFMPTGVYFRDVPDRPYRARRGDSDMEFPVKDENRARLRALFNETFYEALTEVDLYEIQDGVGRDVLMVQGFLVDVISAVPPISPGSSVGTIRWAWEATVVIELRDSMSNDILARAIDRNRGIGPLDAFEIWSHTNQLVHTWSQMLCTRLRELSALGGK